jgi:hypothetical protein
MREQISYFVEHDSKYVEFKSEADTHLLTVSQLAREKTFPSFVPPPFASFLDLMNIFATNLRGLPSGNFYVADCLPGVWRMLNIGCKAKIGIPFHKLVIGGLVPGIICIGKMGGVTTYSKQ